MILFLFGTWGSGKSYVGNYIESRCGLPHMEADLHFSHEMVEAIENLTFHELDLTEYFTRVITEIQSYKRRTDQFVVNQAIYQEQYRQMLFDVFAPEIKFIHVWVPNPMMQMKRLENRAEDLDNPINAQVYAYMEHHWEPPELPHQVLRNDENMSTHLKKLLGNIGACPFWED